MQEVWPMVAVRLRLFDVEAEPPDESVLFGMI
jgi:hypothetical protein